MRGKEGGTEGKRDGERKHGRVQVGNIGEEKNDIIFIRRKKKRKEI